MQISGSLPYHILTKSVEGFVGYIEKSICGLIITRLDYEST
jgi:hypothetical protein